MNTPPRNTSKVTPWAPAKLEQQSLFREFAKEHGLTIVLPENCPSTPEGQRSNTTECPPAPRNFRLDQNDLETRLQNLEVRRLADQFNNLDTILLSTEDISTPPKKPNKKRRVEY